MIELLSETQLSALLPPSIRYVLVIATQRYPRYLLRVLNSFDELYALLMVIVERHFLHTYGGGFVEHFYGLKRERVLHVPGGEIPRTQQAAPTHVREALQLRTSDVWKNLAVMVGVPYLKRKLDESYEIYGPQAAIVGPRYQRDELPPDATLRQRFMFYYKWFLRNIYPSVNGAYYFSILAFNLGYLFSNTAYSSPFLWMVQTRIRRLGVADYRAIAEAEALPSVPAASARPGQSNSIFNPRHFTTVIIPRILSGLKFFLPASIFALKFLEWWHASDFARQLSRKATESLQLPPPVISGMPPPAAETPIPPKNSVALASDKTTAFEAPVTKPATKQMPRPPTPISTISNLPILTVPAPSAATSALCPICINDIVNPTAAQTGYVFCYTCIFRWVEGSHERQAAWMEGAGGEGWGEEEFDVPTSAEPTSDASTPAGARPAAKLMSRIGKWESGKGRCAVTGRRLLAGTDGLRRVMV
jgi:peroxin-12